MRTPSSWRLAACLPFAFLATSAVAANSTTTTELSRVDVTASRTAADAGRLPQGSILIDNAQLQRMPVSNLAEALRSIGGVSLSQNYYGNVSGSYGAPDLMGFGVTAGQNTLILLNGRKLNTVDSSSVNLGAIPLSAIDHIEVIPGSGSVLYGNGAVGGVINVVTRKHYGNRGRIEGVVGEFNTRGGNVQGSFKAGQVDGILSAGRLLSDNYRDNNASAQTSGFADLRYTSDKAAFYLTTLSSRQQIGLPGTVSNTGLTQSLTQAQTPNDWATDETTQVLPGMSYQLTEAMTLYLDGGFRVREQNAGYYDPTWRDSLGEAVDRTVSVSPRLVGVSRWIVDHRWVVGVDYYRTRYHYDTQIQAYSPWADAPVHERYKRDTRAVYAQDSLALTERTWLTLGARHEWVKSNKESDPAFLPGEDEQVGVWSAGLRHTLSDKVALFAKAERSARYATIDELRPPYGYTSCTTSVCPLATQTGKLYSLGAEWHEGGQYSTLTLWRGKYHNEIAYDPSTFTNTNLDPTQREGASLNSYWQLDKNLWLAVSGTYQEARFDGGSYAGNFVPVVPRVTGYARFDWQVLPQLSLSLAERYQGKQHYDNDQDNHVGAQIPSYRWMDIAATFRPTGAKSVYVSAILHNAENRKGAYDYAVASATGTNYNAYPLPGRYLIVKAGVDF